MVEVRPRDRYKTRGFSPEAILVSEGSGTMTRTRRPPGPPNLDQGSWASRLAVATIILATAGCAAGTPVIWVEKGVSFSTYRAVDVGAVVNQTGKTFDFDVAQSLTDQIRSKLAEHGVPLTQGGSAVDGTLVLKTRLTAYSPGNAAARWALPGAGTTECIVKGELLDGQTGAQLGVLLSHRSISSGGLFSIGADRRILDVVATDIADAVATTLRPQ
jgi:hypothetical protein